MGRIDAIVAGWLVDGSGRSPARNRCIDIRSGRIRRIRSADGQDRAAPKTIDWSGGMVIPGLIDAHVHLFMSGTPDPAVRKRQLAATYDDLEGVIARHVGQHLRAGIVAVRDGGDYGGHALRYRLENEGRPEAPVVIRAAGRAWRVAGRYGKLIGRPVPPGYDLARAIRNCLDPVDHVKLVHSGLNSLKAFGRTTPPQFTTGALAGGVRAAAQRRCPVMVHANGEQPVREAMNAGCRSIEHGFFMGTANLARLAARSLTWVPTAVTMQGYVAHSPAGSTEHEVSRRNLDHQLAQLSKARALGVEVATGTDAGTIGVHHGRALKDEIALLAAAGFSVAESIRCATSNGARLLGLDDLGELAVGRRATLVALKGGPADFPDNLASPAMLVHDGRVIHGPIGARGLSRR